MHLGNGDVKLIRSHAKINVETILGEDFCSRSLSLLVKKKRQTFAFRIHKLGNINEKTFKKKQYEILQDTQSFMAVELEAMADIFQDVKDCTGHAQPSQIDMSSFSSSISPSKPGNLSFFSSPFGQSSGVT